MSRSQLLHCRRRQKLAARGAPSPNSGPGDVATAAILGRLDRAAGLEPHGRERFRGHGGRRAWEAYMRAFRGRQ